MQATDILFWSTLAILLLAFVALFAGIGPTRKRKTPTYRDDYIEEDLKRGVQLMDEHVERKRSADRPPMIRFNPPRFEMVAPDHSI